MAFKRSAVRFRLAPPPTLGVFANFGLAEISARLPLLSPETPPQDGLWARFYGLWGRETPPVSDRQKTVFKDGLVRKRDSMASKAQGRVLLGPAARQACEVLDADPARKPAGNDGLGDGR